MEIINSTTKTESAKHPDSLAELSPSINDAPLVPKNNLATPDVTIEQKHKDAFLRCVATGDRYTEDFSLFNGEVTLQLRCRSIEESDAIMAYLRHQALGGKVKTDYEYQALLRILLLVSQVARLNETEFPTMEKPLFSTVSGTQFVPPAWENRINFWKEKSEALVSSIATAVAEFEARYWAMIKASSDINFWKPGQSTGQ